MPRTNEAKKSARPNQRSLRALTERALAGNEILKASQIEAFYSQILDVSIEGASEAAVIRDLQRDPASGRIQHIDFQRISADKQINVNVPLHFVNEVSCVGVKMSGGTLTYNMTEVETVTYTHLTQPTIYSL